MVDSETNFIMAALSLGRELCRYLHDYGVLIANLTQLRSARLRSGDGRQTGRERSDPRGGRQVFSRRDSMNQQLSSIEVVADPAFSIGLNEDSRAHSRLCDVQRARLARGPGHPRQRSKIGVTPEVICLRPWPRSAAAARASQLPRRRADRVAGRQGPQFSLTEEGRHLNCTRAGNDVVVGGYRPIFERLDHVLREGATSVTRIGAKVGIGSCEISRYDAIPKTIEFIRRFNPDARIVADIGCGDAQYLCAIVELFDGIKESGSSRTAAPMRRAWA